VTETTTSGDTKQQSASHENVPGREFHHPLAGGFLRDWNAALDSSGSEMGGKKHLANRGDRAQLRRCRELDDVLLEPVYYDVRQRLAKLGIDVASDFEGDRRLACVLGLLAWVKENDERRTFSQQLAGRRNESDDAKLSGLRFRRLLQIDDRDELYRSLIGVVRLVGGTVNIPEFVTDIYYWRPDSSSRVRKRWAEDYYSAAPSEP
jgi:CRISPR system Cascade subunit CasB